MTLSVHVSVPKDVEWTAAVTTVERSAEGRARIAWMNTLAAGESQFFHPHDGVAVIVAEGRPGHLAPSMNLAAFAFALGQPVMLVASNEAGTVVGRSDHAEALCTYLVRYRAADGKLTEQWWAEAALAPTVPPAPAPTPELPAQQA